MISVHIGIVSRPHMRSPQNKVLKQSTTLQGSGMSSMNTNPKPPNLKNLETKERTNIRLSVVFGLGEPQGTLRPLWGSI